MLKLVLGLCFFSIHLFGTSHHLEVSRLLKDLYKHYRQCGFNSMLPTLILGVHALESERRYARSKGMEPPDATWIELDMQLISAEKVDYRFYLIDYDLASICLDVILCHNLSHYMIYIYHFKIIL